MKPKEKKAGWADSMGSASALLNIDPGILRAAKRAGAPHFKGSRVLLDGLPEWIRDHAKEMQAKASSDKDRLTCRRLAVQCDRLEFELAARRGDYVSKALVVEGISRILTQFRNLGAQKIENELPTRVCNLAPEEIRPRAKELFDELMVILNQLGALLPD